ncbi:unnamed protein product [Tuber melanosporum]|uniref:(Perigord truffle) hypothetical protein n=1 Tax=Tuber melanosporum (strain Mel28) TaxID=656061 RepID=D5GJM2_TUBMM|nr:unnamed protein product [Tuber melanosporum]
MRCSSSHAIEKKKKKNLGDCSLSPRR